MAKTEATRIRLYPHERAALEAAAKAQGATISEAMRRAIKGQYLDPPNKNGNGAVLVQSPGAVPLVQS
ncbi:MAG: hypothetical protein U0X20_27515 [Caldilineaceae bacterium]